MTTRNHSAEAATANNAGEQIETRAEPVCVRIRSSIVTGNGWLPDLKKGENRRRYEAELDWKQSRSLGIKGSPLGRGWTEEEAKADLVARIMHENGIRLELKDPTVWAVYYDTPRAFGIVREVSIIYHAINKKIEELGKEAEA
jgi:hypothetical protein